MLFRLVRPMMRPGSSMSYFVQRIPADVRARAIGMKLAIPIGSETHQITVTAKAPPLRFSLRTRDPGETKKRQAEVVGYLEAVWQALRNTKPTALTHRQATALAGELYRAWADGEERGETTRAIIHTPQGWIPATVAPAENAAIFKSATTKPDVLASADREKALGPLVDRLLLKKGIAGVDGDTRETLLEAFHLALRDAMVARERNAGGDYSPDLKAGRFPEWQSPKRAEPAKTTLSKTPSSLTGLVEDWWREAQAAGRKPSTYESYSNSMAALVSFLGHDDAHRVTPEDILRFKGHRLATINPRTGKPISAKTVKDSDLAGLKTIFGWAVSNLRMPSNPASGITIPIGMKSSTLRKAHWVRCASTIGRSGWLISRTAGSAGQCTPTCQSSPICGLIRSSEWGS
jgi:hypothetical protein